MATPEDEHASQNDNDGCIDLPLCRNQEGNMDQSPWDGNQDAILHPYKQSPVKQQW